MTLKITKSLQNLRLQQDFKKHTPKYIYAIRYYHHEYQFIFTI